MKGRGGARAGSVAGSARRTILKAAGILSLLLIWEGAHYIASLIPGFPIVFIPSIEEVLGQSLPSLGIFSRLTVDVASLREGGSLVDALKAIGVHSAVTLTRFFSGMICGLALGIGLGLLTALGERISRILSPWVDYLRTVPLLALITVFLVWFGKEEIGKFLFMTFAITVIIFVNTVSAIRNLDPIYARFASTLGASRLDVIRTWLVRAILPELTGGIRVLLGTGWAIVLAAEFIAAQSGLGQILIFSQLYFSPGRMIVILLIFMLYSVVINYGAVKLANYLNRWKE